MKKGQTRPIYLILFFAFGAMVVIVVIGVKFLFLLRGIDPKSIQNFELVAFAKNPYSVANTLILLKPDERTVGEIALHASVTEKLSPDDQAKLDRTIKPYMDMLSYGYYDVKIVKEKKILYEMDSSGRKCGTKDEGFCSTPQTSPLSIGTLAYPCGVGRKQIDDAGKCPSFLSSSVPLVCCAEDYKPGIEEYENRADKPPVLRCGPNSAGICDYWCSEGRREVDDSLNPCKGRKYTLPVIGKTISFEPVKCCAPVSKVGTVEIGRVISAEVPLPYKTKQTGPIFYCVDTRKPNACPTGELVPGFCGESFKQCCITSVSNLRCKTPVGNGFCLHASKCKGRFEPSSDCPKNSDDTFRCCITADLSGIKTGAPVVTDQKCNFGPEEISETVGKLIVTLGDK